jgi:hypothetical protein
MVLENPKNFVLLLTLKFGLKTGALGQNMKLGLLNLGINRVGASGLNGNTSGRSAEMFGSISLLSILKWNLKAG